MIGDPPIPRPPGYDAKAAAARRKKAIATHYRAARDITPDIYVTKGIRYRPCGSTQVWSVRRHGNAADEVFFDTKAEAISAALAMEGRP